MSHLRAVIEKYTRNTRFCLICNYVNKIIPALQSRCTRFRFPPLADSYVRSRLEYVIDSERWVLLFPQLPCCCACFQVPVPHNIVLSIGLPEGSGVDSVNLGEGGLDAVVTLGAGDMRRTLNILQVDTQPSSDHNLAKYSGCAAG